MKSMKVEDIRKMGADELHDKIDDAREEMMKLRFQQTTGQLTDTTHLRVLRRDIARIETILRQIQLIAIEGAK